MARINKDKYKIHFRGHDFLNESVTSYKFENGQLIIEFDDEIIIDDYGKTIVFKELLEMKEDGDNVSIDIEILDRRNDLLYTETYIGNVIAINKEDFPYNYIPISEDEDDDDYGCHEDFIYPRINLVIDVNYVDVK